MNQKQLANVLLKLLGLSVCLHAVPSLITDIFMGITALAAGKSNEAGMRFLHWAAGLVAEVVIALVLIVKSRNVAAYLFKNDEA